MRRKGQALILKGPEIYKDSTESKSMENIDTQTMAGHCVLRKSMFQRVNFVWTLKQEKG
jgi:hypothetical protein